MEYKSVNFSEACEKFAKWIESVEKRLESCHCSSNLNQNINNNNTNNTSFPTANSNGVTLIPATTQDPRLVLLNKWKNVINQHKTLQAEVENYGPKLNCEVKLHLNEDKSLTKEQWDEASNLEAKWHKLWLESLEQLVIVERTRRCPKHNTTLIGKPQSKTTSPNSKTNGLNNNLAKLRRPRPISYPNNYNDRLEWDYKNTLSLTGCHKENGSHIDLDSVDEQVTKNLIEFGENYELFFPLEDVINCTTQPTVHSRPPSVEPAEKPQLAKAIVTSSNLNDSHEDVNRNLLMLTTPSSILSVDASRCLHISTARKKPKTSCIWRLFFYFFVGFMVFIFSLFYQEPHQLHRSYTRAEPPV